MTKKTILYCLLFFLAGCGNLSPRISPELQQEIDNQNGKIDEIESNQNSIKNEMFNLKTQADIRDSELKEVQQGWLNLQKLFSSENTNNGVQIFSGPGGSMIALVGTMSIVALVVCIFHYKSMSEKNGKIADILMDKVVRAKDAALSEQVLTAAMYTDVEKDIIKLFNKKRTI